MNNYRDDRSSDSSSDEYYDGHRAYHGRHGRRHRRHRREGNIFTRTINNRPPSAPGKIVLPFDIYSNTYLASEFNQAYLNNALTI